MEVAGREDDGLVEELVDGVQQLVALLDTVDHVVEALRSKEMGVKLRFLRFFFFLPGWT